MSNEVIRKAFAYEGMNVSFAKRGNVVMINATEMAKKFGETPAHWFENEYTYSFIKELAKSRGIEALSDFPITLNTKELAKIYPTLISVVHGGNVSNVTQGTWMHEDIALEFARWLSPAFAIWCNDRIKELLTFGITATPQTIDSILADPDNAIRLLQALKDERQQRQLAESKAALLDEVTKEQAAKIKQDAPKVDYFEHFMTAEHGDTNAGIREVVKQAHIKSEKRFITWMINKGILFRQKKDHRLQPYAEYSSYFDYKDVHDKDNDWSGKHLKFNPYGKQRIVKKYQSQHPEEFDNVQNLFNHNN